MPFSEWVLQPVSPRPISAHFPLLGQGLQGWAHFPQQAWWCSNHYLGQVSLEGLQGEDHGGSHSPVIMPGETEQGVRAAAATGPWRVGRPGGCLAQAWYSLPIDFHHQVWVLKEARVLDEVLVGDDVLVELLWAQTQRVRSEADTSDLTCCPSASRLPHTLPLKPPAGWVWDPAGLLPTCGFCICCAHPRHSPPCSQGKSQLTSKCCFAGPWECPTLAGCIGLHRAENRKGAQPRLPPLLHPTPSANPQKGPGLGQTYPGRCPRCQLAHHRGTALPYPPCPERVLAPAQGWGLPGASGCWVHSTFGAPVHSHWGQRGPQ